MKLANHPLPEDNRIDSLEACFRDIHHQRMVDIPILNPSLSVSAVGFHPWKNHLLGVLITPWFINLVLLPEFPLPEKIGEKKRIVFPAGNFSFIVSREDGIGAFLSCSLMSPVNEINGQTQAVAIAREVLRAIMNPEHADGRGDMQDAEVLQRWHGGDSQPESAEDLQTDDREHDAHRLTRRELFTRALGNKRSSVE